LYRALQVENIESEAPEAVARWSVSGKWCFLMRHSLRDCIKRCVPSVCPSAHCPRFSRSRKAVESVI